MWKPFLLLILFILSPYETVSAESSQDEENAFVSIEDTYDMIYDSLKLDGLDNIYKSVNTGAALDINKLYDGIIHGNGEYVAGEILGAVKRGLSGEVVLNKTLMIELVSIVLIGSVFVNISNSFGQGFISENGFYVTYLIMTAIMLTSFSVTMEMVVGTLGVVLNLIRCIIPIYSLSLNYVGHTTQAAGMYQVVLIGVWLVQVIIIRFILPMIKFYVIISMVNNLNKEDSFSKLCELIKSIVTWLLKTIVIFVAGLNLIKSLIEPQLDALGRNTVTRVTQAIPGGSVMSVLTGTFLGAGMVVKNTVGIVGIIVIGIAALIPVVKVILILFTIKLTGALIQPVGDKRYISGFDALGQGITLLLQAVGASVVMFMLTIAIISFSGG